MTRSYHMISKVMVFRVDASLLMGTGHVMRCLTLAARLADSGADCHFICRGHTGNLVDIVRARGFTVHVLAGEQTACACNDTEVHDDLAHAHWLGVSWQQDAMDCQFILGRLLPDWLIVDHYALDARWERDVLPTATHLLVIDDLADRPHIADVLLDQNLGRKKEDYKELVPFECTLLIGAGYALLRPEFEQWRSYSLERRARQIECTELLISLGGVDKDNATGAVLQAIGGSQLSTTCRITVVMGPTSLWLDAVKTQAAELPWAVEVVINVDDMARRMAEADLAIGAAGSTSWERSCLGLPAIMMVLADNQRIIAESLAEQGAAHVIDLDDVPDKLPAALLACARPGVLQRMSESAALLLDGSGTSRTLDAMVSSDDHRGKT